MPDATLADRPPPTDKASAQTRTFGVDRQDVGAIDDWIGQIGQQWGVGERIIFRARLCVAELAGNVIEHGIPARARRSDDDHMIVSLRRCGDGMEIEFLDSRAPFDPIQQAVVAPVGTIESAPAGGRGLALIRAYAGDLAYRHDGTYNRVTFKMTAH
jgi:serine/threonine-protein kinase RsbW